MTLSALWRNQPWNLMRNSRKTGFDVVKMIEESKQTIRSQEPYIGGESETGERIYRSRDTKREENFLSRYLTLL